MARQHIPLACSEQVSLLRGMPCAALPWTSQPACFLGLSSCIMPCLACVGCLTLMHVCLACDSGTRDCLPACHLLPKGHLACSEKRAPPRGLSCVTWRQCNHFVPLKKKKKKKKDERPAGLAKQRHRTLNHPAGICTRAHMDGGVISMLVED